MSSYFVFNGIQSSMRVPGWYLGADFSLRNSGTYSNKLLIQGQMLTGDAAALDTVRVNSVREAERLWGRGSQIVLMLTAVFANRPGIEIWGQGFADNSEAIGATGNQTATGTMAATGVFVLEIAGIDIAVSVAKDDTAETVVAAFVAAINAHTELPVTAAVNGSTATQLDYSARNAGECGNDISVSIQFLGGGSPGITFDNSAIYLTNGALNPDITPALTAIGDDWFRWIAVPFTDATTMVAYRDWLDERFGPILKAGVRIFLGKRGTHGEILAFTQTLNDPHKILIPCDGIANPAWVVAAAAAIAAGQELSSNSSRPIKDVAVRGIKPPSKRKRWIHQQNDQALFAGCSTLYVDASGLVRFQRVITSRTKTDQGLPDDSRLDINGLEQYEDYRIDQQVLFSGHSRDMLADDDPDLLAVGQPIMTPGKFEGMLKHWYLNDQVRAKGRCTGASAYKPDAVRNGSRIEFIDNPNFVFGLMQIFGRSDVQP